MIREFDLYKDGKRIQTFCVSHNDTKRAIRSAKKYCREFGLYTLVNTETNLQVWQELNRPGFVACKNL